MPGDRPHELPSPGEFWVDEFGRMCLVTRVTSKRVHYRTRSLSRRPGTGFVLGGRRLDGVGLSLWRKAFPLPVRVFHATR